MEAPILNTLAGLVFCAEERPDGGLILTPDGCVMSISKMTALQSPETMHIKEKEIYEWAPKSSSMCS